MYRHPSQISTSKAFLPSPAPDDLSDFDSDLIALIEEKRREIDEEIETFKCRKEKEFEAFMDELRLRGRGNPAHLGKGQISLKSGLSILKEKERNTNGTIARQKPKKVDDTHFSGLIPTPGPSKPSISVDRVTINGLTTPPVIGTPPQGRNHSRSPPKLPGTPPSSSSEKEYAKPPTPSDRENNFHGLFTPGYLQLLDTKPSSLPQDRTSPTITHSKRSLTAPVLPSTSLPSALRPASGTVRKRKHVTFRLAHSVVVDPSSSYEETPSPSDIRDEKDLGHVETDSGIEISHFAFERQGLELDDSMTSLNKTADAASFFTFDEELEDNGEKSSDEHNVRPAKISILNVQANLSTGRPRWFPRAR
jgi:hypothetical protein